MTKRIGCGVLTLILILSLLPGLPLPVSAASQRSSSEEVVAFIKKVEGFNKTAFWDVSQWSIGYGTVGAPGQTITEAEADKAMRKALANIDEKLNEFADKYDLEFSQQEHDALASFSFNCGTGWMKISGRFRRAILDGAELDEFLFYISLWANNNSIPDPILIKRRLCEANIFLNGIYSKSMPEDFSFVIFDPNGGTPGTDGEDKMQGYSLKKPAEILVADPTKPGKVFDGWYTEATGGKKITKLSASTAKQTLYAHYTTETEAEDEEESKPTVLAKGTVVCDTYVNVRSGAGIGYDPVGKVSNGTRVDFYKFKTVNSVKWGKTASGWVCMDYVILDEEPEEEPEEKDEEKDQDETSAQKGKVISQTNLNVRSGPGVSQNRVARLAPGEKVTIYEIKTVSGVRWGRIGTDKWVCMDYIQLDSKEETPKEESTAKFTGRVNSTTNLNVRSGPGVNNARVKSLTPGTQVTVYEQERVSGTEWGRIGTDKWVCLDYITRDSQEEDSEEETTGTGRVISSTVLNLRTGPGISYPLVDQIIPGTKVTILERKTAGGLPWGRTEDGWVCMNYIRMDS